MQNNEHRPGSLERGLPSRPQREVAPDPARLERATTLTNCGLGAPLPGGCALGGFVCDPTRRQASAERPLLARLGKPLHRRIEVKVDLKLVIVPIEDLKQTFTFAVELQQDILTAQAIHWVGFAEHGKRSTQ